MVEIGGMLFCSSPNLCTLACYGAGSSETEAFCPVKMDGVCSSGISSSDFDPLGKYGETIFKILLPHVGRKHKGSQIIDTPPFFRIIIHPEQGLRDGHSIFYQIVSSLLSKLREFLREGGEHREQALKFSVKSTIS